MLELAEYVLNRNVARENQNEPDSGIQQAYTLQTQTSVKYDFDLLDDLLPEDASEDNEVMYKE